MIYLDVTLSLFYSKRLCYSEKHTTNTTDLVYELLMFLVRIYVLWNLHPSFLKGTWREHNECGEVIVAGKTLCVSQTW